MASPVLVIDGDADRVAELADAVRNFASGSAVVLDARDARTALHRLGAIHSAQGNRLPDALIVCVDPRSWAAAVIITAVRRLVPDDCLQLALVAEGPLEALPLRVTDLPKAALVMPHGDPAATVVELVRGKRDHATVLRVIERLALALSPLGMPRMPARVLVGLLVTDSGRLTAAELAGLLQVSRASVSHAVRYLTRVKLTIREREPGARTDHYRVPDDVWIDAIDSHDTALKVWKRQVQQGVELVGADTPAGVRLAETAAFLEFLPSGYAELREKWRSRQRG